MRIQDFCERTPESLRHSRDGHLEAMKRELATVRSHEASIQQMPPENLSAWQLMVALEARDAARSRLAAAAALYLETDAALKKMEAES